MSAKVKMIALDMDGTTLTDDKEITSYTKEVLERAMEEGIVVLACTGRPATAIPEAFQKLKGVRYAISSNGARILDLEKDEVIFEALIPVAETQKLLEIVSKYDTYREVFWNGIGYTSHEMFAHMSRYMSEYMYSYIRDTRVFVEDLKDCIIEKNQPCDKLHIAFADAKERQQAIQDIYDYDAYELGAALPMSIEITTPGVNKGTGILQLATLLGIQKEEVMAVGDGMNDASMLEVVGYPVAMGNAVDEIKQLAKYITATNNEDGVAKAIEKLAL